MKTIPSQEIKRRGIVAATELLAESASVYVIQGNKPVCVVIDEQRYKELLEAEEESLVAQVRESLEDIKAGRYRVSTADELIRDFKLDEGQVPSRPYRAVRKKARKVHKRPPRA